MAENLFYGVPPRMHLFFAGLLGPGIRDAAGGHFEE
jgi:hypothetical protein